MISAEYVSSLNIKSKEITEAKRRQSLLYKQKSDKTTVDSYNTKFEDKQGLGFPLLESCISWIFFMLQSKIKFYMRM